jgi:hypothetical protein
MAVSLDEVVYGEFDCTLKNSNQRRKRGRFPFLERIRFLFLTTRLAETPPPPSGYSPGQEAEGENPFWFQWHPTNPVIPNATRSEAE